MIIDFEKYQKINEGRFDSTIRDITSDIYAFIKETRPEYGRKKIFRTRIKYYEPFEFVFEIVIDRNYKKYITDKLNYQIFNAWSDVKKGKSFLTMTIDLNPHKEPQIYSKILSEIKGTLRHEFEHLTQFGPNRIEDRPFNTPEEQDQLIKNWEEDKVAKVILDKTEEPAYVLGLYKRAKTEKKLLDTVFKDRLNYFVRHGKINKYQKYKILKRWIEYAKKNLPNAKYEKEET